MAGLIPYGKLANGRMGLLLDDSSGDPLAAAVEVLASLPLVASADNFDGRTVFETSSATMYVFDSGGPSWVALEGVPADVGAVAGTPPTTPTPTQGSLFWDLDTEVAFVYDGSAWVAIGGRYAASYIPQRYVGDGVSTNFPMGTSGTTPPEYVEVFLDGVRQVPNPAGDYSVVGTNIVFTVAPPNGVNIFVRTTVSDALVQNAQVIQANYTALGGEAVLSAGVPGIDPASTFVILNREFQVLNEDYTVGSLDTTITAINKISATTARFSMLNSHSMAVGFNFTVSGTTSEFYNRTFTVTNVVSATQVDATIDAAAPSAATPDTIISYSPPYVNDTIEFVTPLTNGDIVDIRAIQNTVVAPSTGEANTIVDLGGGTGLAGGKAGTALQVKSLVAGTNVNLASTASEVTIGVSSVLSFEERVGINTNNYIVSGSESYIGVLNTLNPVTIDLSGITGSGNTGRRLMVVDESGGASVNNIQINTGGALIDGGAGAYVISTNYGVVSMVFNGTNWFVTSEK